jgi:hypothetical protein
VTTPATHVLFGVAAGVGLAAACGFRVFVPLLVAGLASRFGHMPLAAGTEWIGSTAALIAFATASVLEIGVYYVPWLDHLADIVATPAAIVAGIVAAAAPLVELPPMLKWIVAIVAGGGAATLFQSLSVLLRVKSAALTGGVANPAVSTLELGASAIVAILAVLLPLVAAGLVVVLIVVFLRLRRKFVPRGRPG